MPEPGKPIPPEVGCDRHDMIGGCPFCDAEKAQESNERLRAELRSIAACGDEWSAAIARRALRDVRD